ncbi:MAG: hypothetical protein ACK5MZ_00735 [Aestuariibaculum sp.]
MKQHFFTIILLSAFVLFFHCEQEPISPISEKDKLIYSIPPKPVIDSVLSSYGISDKNNLTMQEINRPNIGFLFIKSNNVPSVLLGIAIKNNKDVIVHHQLNNKNKMFNKKIDDFNEGKLCYDHENNDPQCILTIQELKEVVINSNSKKPDYDLIESIAWNNYTDDMDMFEYYWLEASGWWEDLNDYFSSYSSSDRPDIPGPEKPITNPNDIDDCFDFSELAKLTIYVNEPNPGSGDTSNGRFAGHAFVSIEQGNNISTFGYYPVSNYIIPGINNSSNAILGHDGNDPFSVSVSTYISGSQLQQILNKAINFTPIYHLNTYNCTDFVIELGNLAGMGLPEANGTWTGGGGSNPGTLGLYIRNLIPPNGITTNTTGGNASITYKDC